MRLRLTTVLLATSTFLSVAGLSSPSALSQFKPTKSDEDLNAIGHRNLGKGSNFYSTDKEKELGKVLALEVERSSKLLDDPVVIEYVNRIAQSIAQNSDAKFPITVRVIDSNMIDALCLPGGYQYVNRGLILAAESEAELAGVLAHGIAHTAMRAGTREATKGELTQLTSIPAMIFIPYSMAGAMYEGSNLAIPLTFLKYHRDAESAADFYGVQYLYKAGYNAESYPRFLERVWPQATQGKNISKTFSSFPPLSDRLKALREEIARLLPRRDTDIVSSPGFAAIQERLRSWTPTPEKSSGPPAALQKPTLRKPGEPPVKQTPPLPHPTLLPFRISLF